VGNRKTKKDDWTWGVAFKVEVIFMFVCWILRFMLKEIDDFDKF
jgi:hypothetical protein